MRAVVQRVSFAKVESEGVLLGLIGQGLLVLVGIEESDTQKDIEYIVDKCSYLRVFDDESGVMNLSAMETQSDILVISQFTIMGDARKGRRPSYIRAASPKIAITIFNDTLAAFKKTGLRVQTGRFAADMQVSLLNDGPVTILLDSNKRF
jgi:D-tyrosyl-tRNA(Tyr) deacylase